MDKVNKKDNLPKLTSKLREFFSCRLRYLRKLAGLTQEELSSAINVNRSYISQLESGDATPSIEIVYSFSQLFGCSTDYLLGLDRRRQSPMEKTIPVIDEYKVGLPIDEQKIVGTIYVPGHNRVDFAISAPNDGLTDFGIFKGDLIVIRLTKMINEHTTMAYIRVSPSSQPSIFIINKNEQGELIFERPRGRLVPTESEIVKYGDPGIEVIGAATAVFRLFIQKRKEGKEKLVLE